MTKRQLHKLSARTAETITDKGLHSDGGGLYLAVGDGGARSWLFVYRERGTGKRRELGLGAGKAKGLRCGENPGRWRGHLSVLMDKKVRKKKHHPAAQYSEMPGIVTVLKANKNTINLALEYTILTAARTNESRQMLVREVNF